MTSSARVKRHRDSKHMAVRRVEVTVAPKDAARIKQAAGLLRRNDQVAEKIRQFLDSVDTAPKTALDLFKPLWALYPPGPPLDLSRDDMAPDRDFEL
jgi:hypothetical protein